MKKISLILAGFVLTTFATSSIKPLFSSQPNHKLDILVHHYKINKPILIDIKKPVKEKKVEVTKTNTQAS